MFGLSFIISELNFIFDDTSNGFIEFVTFSNSGGMFWEEDGCGCECGYGCEC